MAGKKKTIYLAYDHTIEDEKSLQDFITKILSSAGYPIASIYVIDKTKIESIIDDTDYQFIISLNATYRDTSIYLSRALKQPPHRFFSRFYKDPEKKILSLGILQSVKEILGGDQGTKLNVWEKVKDFLVEYLDYIDSVGSVTKETVEPEVKDVQEELPLVVEEEKAVETVISSLSSRVSTISGNITSISVNDNPNSVTFNFNAIKDLPITMKVKLLTELQSNILNELIGGK